MSSIAQTAEGEKILIVDDDPGLSSLLERFFVSKGYRARAVPNVEQMDRLLAREVFNLVVLDLMLPGEDGLSACRRLRAAGNRVPIIMLTAKGDELSRIKGLELGADDYLVKPFAFSELLARVRTLLRRGSSMPQETTLQLADLSLDLIRRRVERSGQRIDLTAKEFALLELLLRRQGEVLPKTLIASQVWDMNFDSDTNIIEVAIRRLRLKVDDNFPTKLIHTVRGMGYVLEERFT